MLRMVERIQGDSVPEDFVKLSTLDFFFMGENKSQGIIYIYHCCFIFKTL